MIVKLAIHPDQIRWYVQSALNGFDTLDKDDAIENACHDLRSILTYLDALDAADKAVAVAGVEGIKPSVRLELRVGQDNAGHQPHLKIARFPTV